MLVSDVVGVFGANSFIGRHIVRGLVRNAVPVIAYGRKFSDDFSDFIGAPVETRLVDFSDDLEAHASIQGLTHIVQLVNTSNPAMANRRVVSDVQHNIIPHISFIESCIATGIKHYTFLSSGGTIYGNPSVVPIPETHPADPLNSYGMGKRVVEKYLAMLCRGTDMGYSVLRIANPFGPGQMNLKGQGLIPTILQRHGAGLPVVIFGDGGSQRDYVYIDDVVAAVLATVERPPLQGVVNIGSGQGRTILEIVETIEHLLGVSVERSFAPARPTDTPCNILDIGKAKELLGWSPSTEFIDGMRMTLAGFLDRSAHQDR
jgi:UDP-glucose 4-epimerase